MKKIAVVEILNLDESSAPNLDKIKQAVVDALTNDDIPITATEKNVIFSFPSSLSTEPDPTIIVKITACCNQVHDARGSSGPRIGKILLALFQKTAPERLKPQRPIEVIFYKNTDYWFFKPED